MSVCNFLHNYSVRLECKHPFHVFVPGHGYLRVGCGKCPVCASKRSSSWQIRLKEEAKNHARNLFVTLTYDDAHLPYYNGTPTFCKRHIQLFFKRLRKFISKSSGEKIKYFLISEYGPNTFRPHYHFIFFNFPTNIINPQSFIEDFWDKGFVKVDSLNQARISYVAKYATKFSVLPENYRFVERDPITHKIISRPLSPFTMCSKGIGLSFLTDSIKNYYRTTLNCQYNDNGFKKPLPRYYKDKLFDDEMKYILLEMAFDDQRSYLEWYNDTFSFYDRTHLISRREEVYISFVDKIKRKCKKRKTHYVEI